MQEGESHAAIERAARDSYAQLLSFVAARTGGDVAGAEDALGEAFLAALRQWPGEGVPAHFENIGIRIEDDLLVTAAGYENLTAAAPKSVSDIESLMRG